MKKVILFLSLFLILGFTACGSQLPITSFATAQGNVLGSDDAKINIELYSDYQCPYCRLAEKEVYELVKYYGDDIRFEFKDYVVHETALNAHLAANCAADQNKFWEYHTLLFENQNAQQITDLRDYALEAGLDVDSFDECLLNKDALDDIKEDMGGGAVIGVRATPTFVINGEVYEGVLSFGKFKQIIDEKLEE